LTIKFTPSEIPRNLKRENPTAFSAYTRRYLVVKDRDFRLYRKSTARFLERLISGTPWWWR